MGNRGTHVLISPPGESALTDPAGPAQGSFGANIDGQPFQTRGTAPEQSQMLDCAMVHVVHEVVISDVPSERRERCLLKRP